MDSIRVHVKYFCVFTSEGIGILKHMSTTLCFMLQMPTTWYIVFFHLQANLAINPAALLPGAAPPVKEPEPTVIGFDQPVQAKTLHTAQKVLVISRDSDCPFTSYVSIAIYIYFILVFLLVVRHEG